MNTAEARFRQMGSEAHLIVVADHPDELLGYARSRLAQLEDTWSRFDPDSEISRINRSRDSVLIVSEDTRALVERSLDARRLTDGRFDPTVLGDVIRNGYDRDLDELDGHPGDSMLISGDLRIDGVVLFRSPGVGIDPGGIGKGLGADLVTEELMQAGALGASVNLGGDLRARGRSPAGGGWTFTIDHPDQADPVATVGVSDGAIATSTALLRAWGDPEHRRHHIIDPSTGTSADSRFEFVSVIAAHAWIAEAHAKSVLIGGPRVLSTLDGADIAVLAVDDDGHVHTTTDYSRFTGGIDPTHILEGAHT